MVTALGLEPTSEELTRALSHPTENIEAYQLYLRGRNRMRGQQDPENVKSCYWSLRRGLEAGCWLRPSICWDFRRRTAALSHNQGSQSWAQKALSSALQGQRLDERLLDVRLALASVYQATGKTAEAIAELTIAAKLAPSSDDVFRRLGRAYLSTGRGEDAIRAYQTAITINPYYWVSYGRRCRRTCNSDVTKAAERLKKVIELEPENASGYNDLGPCIYRSVATTMPSTLSRKLFNSSRSHKHIPILVSATHTPAGIRRRFWHLPKRLS